MNKSINLMRRLASGASRVATVYFIVAGATNANAAANRHSILGTVGGTIGAVGRAAGQAAGGLGGAVIGGALRGSKKPVEASTRPIDRPPPAAAPLTTRDHRHPTSTGIERDHRTQPIVRDHRGK